MSLNENAAGSAGNLFDWIPAYLAGTLDKSRVEQFEARLEEDLELRAALGEMDRLWESLPDRAPDTAPVALWPLVEARLAESRFVEYPVANQRWRLAASFAAGLLVGLTIWALSTGGPTASSAAEEELLAQESIFETFDPIPPESVGGIYFTALPIQDPNGGSER
jgi:ferric-dicitrate binding protein FerR (iron transport regulator)